MVVRLRLARHGTKNNPFYHVVAIRDKASRDARPIEKLGEYDPIPRPRIIAATSSSSSSSSPSTSERVTGSGLEGKVTVMEKRIEWNADRIKYWIDVGAQPSKPVARLLNKAGLIPEGKTFKGIYKPAAQASQSYSASSSNSSAPLKSAILQAAGVDYTNASPLEESAATAMRQDETARSAEKTNPKAEAMKLGVAESSIDQAA